MKIRSFRYYINEAFRGLIKNRMMAFASVMTVCSCIFMLSLSFCIAVNLNAFLRQLEKTVGLTVYIDMELDADQVNALFTKVKALDNVKFVKYVSAEEALVKFREDLGRNSSLLDGLEKDNPLPRSFNIEMNDALLQPELVIQLEKLQSEGIAEIRYQERIVEVLTALNNSVRIVSGIVIVILLAVSVVIITNTIRITVNSRRLEIHIMKYVGATDWFIRWPFIIEGVLIGLFGSAIPLAIFMPGYSRILVIAYGQLPMLQSIITFVPGVEVFRTLIPLCLVFGAAIGITGSATSIRRHLKV